jgi:hypothetical protein
VRFSHARAVLFALSFACGKPPETPAAGRATPSAGDAPASSTAAARGGAATSAPEARVPLAVTPNGEVTVGKAPPDFTATAHDGTRVHLAPLRGKPVVGFFLASSSFFGFYKRNPRPAPIHQRDADGHGRIPWAPGDPPEAGDQAKIEEKTQVISKAFTGPNLA